MLRHLIKNQILLIALFSLIIFSACAQKAEVTKEQEKAKPVSVMDMVKEAGFEIVDFSYVQSKVGDGLRKFNEVVIIDARPERKYETGHIPGAINIPDNKFDTFYPQLEKLKVLKDTELIVYCGGFNCIKSYNNAKYLRDKGYNNIKVYLAGDPDWAKKSYFEISTPYAEKLFNEGVYFLDARPERVYEKGTIPGAVNIPDTKFIRSPEQYLDLLPSDKNTPIVTFCGGYICVKSHIVANQLIKMGYKNVFVYAAGVPEWKEKGLPLGKPGEKAEIKTEKSVPVKAAVIKPGKEEGTVDVEFFKTLIDERPDDILIVDVRSEREFNSGHIKGAININVDDIYKDCSLVSSKLPKDKYIIFMCSTGGRAGEMYFGLKEDCNYPHMDKLFFLDANVDFSSGKCVIK